VLELLDAIEQLYSRSHRPVVDFAMDVEPALREIRREKIHIADPELRQRLTDANDLLANPETVGDAGSTVRAVCHELVEIIGAYVRGESLPPLSTHWKEFVALFEEWNDDMAKQYEEFRHQE
jgi:hypothetical protein